MPSNSSGSARSARERHIAAWRLVIALAVIGSVGPVRAQGGPNGRVTMRIDGRTITSELAPRFIGDSMHVPAKDFILGLGAEMEWDEAAKTITTVLPTMRVVFTLLSPIATRDGAPFDVGLPVVVVEDKAFLPCRLIDAALGCETEWQAEEKRVEIVCAWEKRQVSVGELLRWPVFLSGKEIIVRGAYRGWLPGEAGSAVEAGRPKRRADWVLRDATGAIYISGRSPKGLDPIDDVGRTVTVEGTGDRTEAGIPFVEAKSASIAETQVQAPGE